MIRLKSQACNCLFRRLRSNSTLRCREVSLPAAGHSVPGDRDANGGGEPDRVELPAIELERLGDGEGLKDLTDRAIRTVERAAIEAALRRDRNPALAAPRLGISRASIYTKMKAYGLAADGTPAVE